MLRELSNLVKNTEIIGLDIGTHSIKLVEIDHRKQGMFLTTFAVSSHTVPLDGYWDSKTLREMSKLIDGMMRKSNFVGLKTVMSVRSKDVYVTTMDFDPQLTEQEIKDEINRQASFFLPLPPEQMRLSFDLLTSPTINGKKRVIINAIPDYIVENGRNLLEHLNLDGEAIENSTLSHVRSCLSDTTADVLLVDIGGNHTVLSFVSHGNLRSSTYIPNGTQEIAQVMADLTGTGLDIGEEFMRDLNLVDLAHLPKPYLDYMEVLQSEMDNFVQLNQQIGQNPEIVVFTGGGVNTPGLLEFFASYRLPCRIATPLTNLQLDEKIVPYISPIQNQLAVAIGLAKRSDVL